MKSLSITITFKSNFYYIVYDMIYTCAFSNKENTVLSKKKYHKLNILQIIYICREKKKSTIQCVVLSI